MTAEQAAQVIIELQVIQGLLVVIGLCLLYSVIYEAIK